MNGTDATINKNNKVIKIVTIDSQAAMILALLGSALALPQTWDPKTRTWIEPAHGSYDPGRPYGDNPHGYKTYYPSKDGIIREVLPDGRIVVSDG